MSLAGWEVLEAKVEMVALEVEMVALEVEMVALEVPDVSDRKCGLVVTWA
jgi:hypothetical protein